MLVVDSILAMELADCGPQGASEKIDDLKGHDFRHATVFAVLKGHDFRHATVFAVLKGHDFSRAANGTKEMRALAPEGTNG
jgi:hypothetical protein